MKILLIGKNGQVGWELQRTLLPLGEVVAVDYPEIDLTDVNQTRHMVRKIQPQVIVNAAAYTNVDQAEADKEIAFAVNGVAPGVLAVEAEKIGSIFVHYSTDYVFNGQKGSPYLEEDQPNPINVYGESKFAGERAVQEVNGMYLILRTSWVYSLRCPCFVTKILLWAREKKTLRIVEDQIGNPTWCRTLAEITAQILSKEKPTFVDWIEQKKGIYHLAGKGSASRYEWVKKILKNDPQRNQQVVERILPAKTSEFDTPAARPAFSALNCNKVEEVFKLRIPPWEEQLTLALDRGKKMIFESTTISDVIVIKPNIYEDERGFFMETYQREEFSSNGINIEFVQENHSGSKQGVLRGLHYQIQNTQGKLVRAVSGKIFDVAVDLRKDSPTIGKWVGVYLSGENKYQLWIPGGFAHGYYTVSQWADVVYKVTDYYASEWDRTLLWNDIEVGIEWPLLDNLPPMLSDKDARGMIFLEADKFLGEIG